MVSIWDIYLCKNKLNKTKGQSKFKVYLGYVLDISMM